MDYEVGAVYEGRVTGITKFGAFVSLPGGKSGLVHISEIANSFVADINEHIKVGQSVRVKLLAMTPDGKLNLSIKKAMEPPPQSENPARTQNGFHRESREARSQAPREERPPQPAAPSRSAPRPQTVNGPSDNQDFESKLQKFMKESDSRISDNPYYNDRPRRSSRRRG